jgi:hypothetical protein
MPCELRTTEKFEKEAKRLIKKFPSLKSELKVLSESLSLNPKQGTAIGKNFFKIRLAIKSKGSGKSGGARVITNLIVQRRELEILDRLYLATIYDKSEKGNVTDKELESMLKEITAREK